MTLLKKQTDIIKAFQHANTTCKNIAIPTNISVTSPEVNKIISVKTVQVKKKTVNLASTTNLQNNLSANKNNIDIDDSDSKDEDVVIYMKENETLKSKNNENEPENDKCKYINYIIFQLSFVKMKCILYNHVISQIIRKLLRSWKNH
jgi:hypothetical protein